MLSEEIQAKLQEFGYNLKLISDDYEGLTELLVKDLWASRTATAEAQALLASQAHDLKVAYEKVSTAAAEVTVKGRHIRHLEDLLSQQIKNNGAHDNEITPSIVRNLENQVYVLRNALVSEKERCGALEGERDGLKAKVQSLLLIQDDCRALDISVVDIATTIEGSKKPSKDLNGSNNHNHNNADGSTPGDSASAVMKPGGTALVKAAAERIRALELELNTCRNQLEASNDLVSSLRSACEAQAQELAVMASQLAAARGAVDQDAFQQLSKYAEKLADEIEAFRRNAPQSQQALAETRAAHQAAEAANATLKRQLRELRAHIENIEAEDSHKFKVLEEKISKLRVAVDQARGQAAEARAATEMARGTVAELEDRLARRDSALQHAQSRCRSLEADLHRLRQLQTLKGGGQKEETPESLVLIEDSARAEQLKLQCASMASHLQKATELQEAALQAASKAVAERDEAVVMAATLARELEHVKSTLSALPPSSDKNEPKRQMHHSGCSPIVLSPPPSYNTRINNSSRTSSCVSSEAMQEEESSSPTVVPLEVSERVESMDEGGYGEQKKDQIILEMRNELERTKCECDQLAAACAQADLTMQQCLAQLQQKSKELQESNAAASTARDMLQMREVQLKHLQGAVQELEAEKTALSQQLVSCQQSADQRVEGLSSILEAERNASCIDFDALRSEMQGLSARYQQLCHQASSLQQERDTALTLAERSAMEVKFHENQAQCKEMELAEVSRAYHSLIQENQQLQQTLCTVRQELNMQTYHARLGSDLTTVALQRRLVAADGNAAVLEARLTEVTTEAATLRQQLEAHATRNEQLEDLLLQERSRQFNEEQRSGHYNRSPLSEPALPTIDAVDETLLQRLAELEEECGRLKEERNANSQIHLDLLSELAHVSNRLQEEQRRGGIGNKEEEEEKQVDNGATNTTNNNNRDEQCRMLSKLHTIAQGLRVIGNSCTLKEGVEHEKTDDA